MRNSTRATAAEVIRTSHSARPCEGTQSSRLVFHFKDGSVHEKTAVLSQCRNFRLLNDHLVQKGSGIPASDGTLDRRFRRPSHSSQRRRRWQGEGGNVAARSAAGCGQRFGSHTTEEPSSRCNADENVYGGGNPKAAPSETGGHCPRRGTVLARGLRSQSHALRG